MDTGHHKTEVDGTRLLKNFRQEGRATEDLLPHIRCRHQGSSMMAIIHHAPQNGIPIRILIPKEGLDTGITVTVRVVNPQIFHRGAPEDLPLGACHQTLDLPKI